MECIRFLCKLSGKPILSNSFSGDAVHLFILKNGKVIESMFGNYNGYGSVFDGEGSLKWEMEWSDVFSLMFDGDKSNGISAILDSEWFGVHPRTRSEYDPNQGWGISSNLWKKVTKPYHKIYTDDELKELNRVGDWHKEIDNEILDSILSSEMFMKANIKEIDE